MNDKKPIDIEALSAIEQEATPAPWAYTEHCGAQVCAGLIHNQEPGEVRMEKHGFFLFEIDPNAYDRGDGKIEDEEELEAMAFADVKLIACMRNALPQLIAELETARQENAILKKRLLGAISELEIAEGALFGALDLFGA